MSFQAILSVPVIYGKSRDSVNISCTFTSEAQYHAMAKENFNSIYSLIYNIVQARKGKNWEPDLETSVHSLEDPADLVSIGSF